MSETLPQSEHHPAEGEFQRIALLLQGGGALGAYQAGAFEALTEHGVAHDWVAGISIGAINSAIIAGNPPEHRVPRLREFWELVSSGATGFPWSCQAMSAWEGDEARRQKNRLYAGLAMTTGVPGFYKPRVPPSVFLPMGAPGATSYYDTSELKKTLERLVDFDLLNEEGGMRFTVGAVNLRSGNFELFDNRETKITAKHVMASGALPPAFDAVEIDGEYFWDGGLVSNTPLDWVILKPPMVDTLIFQVDLWSAQGRLPRDLGQVATRMKEIQYSSRTRASTDHFRDLQRARAAIGELLSKLPEEHLQGEEIEYLKEISHRRAYNIVHLILKSPSYELESKDHEFSRTTMLDHWQRGFQDVQRTLRHPEIFQRSRTRHGVKVFDFCAHH
jgi:NTE family protein